MSQKYRPGAIIGVSNFDPYPYFLGQSGVTIPRPQLRELSAELCLKGGLPVKAQHLWWLTIPGRLQNLSIETANIWLEEERPILSLCN